MSITLKTNQEVSNEKMKELIIDPIPMSKKEINKALGEMLWGKNNGNFSMRRFAMAIIKKQLKKEKKYSK